VVIKQAFAQYAYKKIDNPEELNKIRHFLTQFDNTIKIDEEIAELGKSDDTEDKDRLEKLQEKEKVGSFSFRKSEFKIPRLQIVKVRSLYEEVFAKGIDLERKFLNENSKQFLFDNETEKGEIFQNSFRVLQQRLHPDFRDKEHAESKKETKTIQIKTSDGNGKIIEGNDIGELYDDFKNEKLFKTGFSSFVMVKEYKRQLLQDYKSFFNNKKHELLKDSHDLDEISRFLSFYKKFHSLCSRHFASKHNTENEMVGGDLKTFDEIDKDVGIDDFRKKIVDKFLVELDNAKNKENKIQEFAQKITDEDTSKLFTTKLQEKIHQHFDKLPNQIANAKNFFEKHQPEIKHIGIKKFRDKVRDKIYDITDPNDQKELFEAYKESGIDQSAQTLFRAFIENDKDKEELRRKLRDNLTKAENYQQKFYDFVDDNPHLFLLMAFNPLTSTILSCVDNIAKNFSIPNSLINPKSTSSNLSKPKENNLNK